MALPITPLKMLPTTNLLKFNRNEPTEEDVVEFKDARFYTDYHFLKLASQLKDKTITNQVVLKPVNVVEPTRVVEKNSETRIISEPISPISSALWKLQREQYEDRVMYLEEQIKGLYEQLEIQTQINSEIKKLLVASIGDDIQYKIERLVNDKQRFEFELTNNSKRLANISEELEQISIQCDLWRTKFLASKAMNDELSTWKTFLLLLQQENNHLMRNVLAENESNNIKLNNIYKKLSKNKNICGKNNVLLVNSIEKLVDEIFIEKLETDAINCEVNIMSLTTKNEFLAKQLLIQFAWLPFSNTSSVEIIESLLNGLKMQKTKLITRYDQFNDDIINLKCCSKCTGNIKIV
jgi:hypothetical protein